MAVLSTKYSIDCIVKSMEFLSDKMKCRNFEILAAICLYPGVSAHYIVYNSVLPSIPSFMANLTSDETEVSLKVSLIIAFIDYFLLLLIVTRPLL